MCFGAVLDVVSVYACSFIVTVASCYKASCVPEVFVTMQSILIN